MNQQQHQYGDLGNQFEAHRQELINQNIFNERLFFVIINNNLNSTFQEILTEYQTAYVMMITSPDYNGGGDDSDDESDDDSDDNDENGHENNVVADYQYNENEAGPDPLADIDI